jgi:glycosyltransferase involved in cell wall biosynthesis
LDNADHYIADIIESALAQTSLRTELVIVNDAGSVDRMQEMLSRFASKDVMVPTHPNQRAAATRNKITVVRTVIRL